MAFAARLASKRKAEEGGGEIEEESEESAERGLGRGGMSSLLMQGDRSDTGIRNPFADDEEEGSDEGSEEGSDDGDLGAASADGAGGGSSWNRGGWWRGALGTRSKKPGEKSEKFGDGRDSSSDEEMGEGGAEGANSSEEDEEFGDFAMPEEQGGASGSGIDDDREKVLVKPQPVHPPGAGSGGGTLGNKGLMALWPFTKKDKDASPGKDEEAEADKSGEGEAEGEKTEGEAEGKADAAVEGEKKQAEEPPVVLSEDGEKVQPTVEAKRRTSIEEPDEGEDEVVV